jgi:gliding motility-associated-like protein
LTADKTNICYGQVAHLVANGAFNYQWTPATDLDNPTSNFVNASPKQTTIYVVSGMNGACTGTAMVQINVVNRPELLLNTSNNRICEGNSTTIFASGSQNYNWSPMQTINLISPNTALVNPIQNTNYTITAYNTSGTLNCSVTREILIEVVPQVTATVSDNVTICEGESIRLYASGSNMYVWNPTVGLTDPTINNPFASPKSTTVYEVIVSNGGYCGATGTVMVTVRPQPTVDAGLGGTFNLDEPMYLNAIGNGSLTWVSGDGIQCDFCPNTQITTNKSGCYKIQAVNQYGCKAYDDVCIEVTANYNLYIPNSFTPNDDGNNDVFQIYGTGFSKVEISIFDRWGEKLFTTTDAQKGWDGGYKGQTVKEDSYVYQVKFTTLDGKSHTKTGHVTVLK